MRTRASTHACRRGKREGEIGTGRYKGWELKSTASKHQPPNNLKISKQLYLLVLHGYNYAAFFPPPSHRPVPPFRTHTRTHIDTDTHTHTHTCTHTPHTRTDTHTHTRTHTCSHTHTDEHTHTHVHIHIRTDSSTLMLYMSLLHSSACS